jgi:hypothetical protein
MKTPFKILFILFIITSFSSCKKYEDGPAISFISKKERISNTWHVANYYENGTDKTTDFNNVLQNAVLTIEKSGSYHFSYKAFGLVDYNETGTWNFTNDDKDFITNPSTGTGTTATHHILKLRENELWYTDDADANGIKREYHLKP